MNPLSHFFSPTSYGCIGTMVLALAVPGCPEFNATTVKLEVKPVDQELHYEWEQGSYYYTDRGEANSRFRADATAGISFFETHNPGQHFDETKYELEFSVPGVSVIYQRFFLTRESPIDGILRGSDGLIRSRFKQRDSNMSEVRTEGFVEAHLRIDPTVPIRPILISLRGTTKDGITTYSKRYPLYLRRQGTEHAPRIQEVTVPAAFRGTRVPIAVTGRFFDTTAQILMDDGRAIGVEDMFYDASTSTLSAILAIGPDADTGYSKFHIETDAGGSADRLIFVQAPRPVDVSGVYPNYGVVGSPVEVTLSGDGFHQGMRIVSVPGTAIDTNPVSFVDRYNVRMRVTPEATGPGPTALDAHTLGGMESILFPVHPQGFKGPRITGVKPRQLVLGSRNVQIEIEGENFDTSQPTGAASLSNETTGTVFAVGGGHRILPRSAPHRGRAVFFCNVSSRARRGLFDLVLVTADGLAANVAPMEIVAPPPYPLPYLQGTQVLGSNHLERGDAQPASVSILGGRFMGVQRIKCRHPGLTATIVSHNDYTINATFQADGTVPLSGDQATTFTVVTSHGESNESSVVVADNVP